MLKASYIENVIEAGCDEAGRGPLAGSVFAAAVILDAGLLEKEEHREWLSLLNDSKQLTDKQRQYLRPLIEQYARSWAVVEVTAEEIDKINILRASILAMHRAVDALKVRPEHLLIDGNKFNPYPGITHNTVVKGDATFMSIAAASVLAKTYRDDYMMRIAEEYPMYDWQSNKGYPTAKHRAAIRDHGTTPYHRMSFNLLGEEPKQLELSFE